MRIHCWLSLRITKLSLHIIMALPVCILKNYEQEIAGEDGLAQRERTQLYMESSDQKSSGSSQRTKASLWQVYLQILGLSKEETKKLRKRQVCLSLR